MVKRRTTLLGLGALATGSGATLTAATLNNSVTADTAALDVVAVAELNVRRGDSDYDDDSFDPGVSDLPAASVQGSTQDGNDLEILTKTRNSSDDKNFDYLLEIENNSTDAVSVGIGFGFNDTFLDDEDVTDTDEDDLQDMHSFTVNDGESTYGASDGNEISPTSGNASDDPENFEEIPSGETLAVDLTINPDGDIVSDINSFVDVSGNLFEDDASGEVTLIDEIEIGTENENI